MKVKPHADGVQKTSSRTVSRFSCAYCREAAVINVFLLEKDSILNENGNSF